MKEKKIIHSRGMVSFDAESIETDAATIEVIKETKLYQSLVGFVGKEQASQIIREGYQEPAGVPAAIGDRQRET